MGELAVYEEVLRDGEHLLVDGEILEGLVIDLSRFGIVTQGEG